MIKTNYFVTKVTIVTKLQEEKHLMELELEGKPTVKQIKEHLQEDDIYVSKEVEERELSFTLEQL